MTLLSQMKWRRDLHSTWGAMTAGLGGFMAKRPTGRSKISGKELPSHLPHLERKTKVSRGERMKEIAELREEPSVTESKGTERESKETKRWLFERLN